MLEINGMYETMARGDNEVDRVLENISAEQHIKLLNYIKENGIDELKELSNDYWEILGFDRNGNGEYKTELIRYCYNDYLRANNYFYSFSYKIFLQTLKKYPKLYAFLKQNNMLNRVDLLSKNFDNYIGCFDVKKIDMYIDLFTQASELGVNPIYGRTDCEYSDLYVDAIYDISNRGERLVKLKKLYCQMPLKYTLYGQEIYENEGSTFRHEKYFVDYDDAAIANVIKKCNIVYGFDQAAAHNWVIMVLNDGKTLTKHMIYNDPEFGFSTDAGVNFPTREEVDGMSLPKALQKCRGALKSKGSIIF